MESNAEIIGAWEVVQLYTAALRKHADIEAISVGYSLLEIQLSYLARSKAGPGGVPLAEDDIASCRYLMQLAALTRDRGFLPQHTFEKIRAFNDGRIRAIHKLASSTVTRAELEVAALAANDIWGEIQDLWLTVTVGPEVRVGDGQ